MDNIFVMQMLEATNDIINLNDIFISIRGTKMSTYDIVTRHRRVFPQIIGKCIDLPPGSHDAELSRVLTQIAYAIKRLDVRMMKPSPFDCFFHKNLMTDTTSEGSTR